MNLRDHIWTPKAVAMAAIFLVGLMIFVVAVYSLIAEVVFLQHATPHDATIVEVRRELVQKGKGSVLAFVPFVNITDASHDPVKLRVDTYNEEAVYQVGQQLRILCDESDQCLPNTFWDRWGDSLILFVLAFVFLAVPVLNHYRR